MQAWEERNLAFYKGTNESIAHSAYDAKIKSLYSQQQTINKRDSYQPLLELLKAWLGKNRMFIEKAESLFNESVCLAKQGLQHIHQFYRTIPRHLTEKQLRTTV